MHATSWTSRAAYHDVSYSAEALSVLSSLRVEQRPRATFCISPLEVEDDDVSSPTAVEAVLRAWTVQERDEEEVGFPRSRGSATLARVVVNWSWSFQNDVFSHVQPRKSEQQTCHRSTREPMAWYLRLCHANTPSPLGEHTQVMQRLPGFPDPPHACVGHEASRVASRRLLSLYLSTHVGTWVGSTIPHRLETWPQVPPCSR